MYFEPITDICSGIQKKDFIAKINNFVRMTELLALKYAVDAESRDYNTSNQTLKYLKGMGCLKSACDLDKVKKLLGTVTYHRLINAANICSKYKKVIASKLKKTNNKERLKEQKKNLKQNKPIVIDLFCGAGGLSHGFVEAGFKVRLALDNNKESIDTYTYNHAETPYKNILNCDIQTVVSQIDEYLDADIDVVMGGPPCQGFSSANKQRVVNDKRNVLYKQFVTVIEKAMPKVALMENVPGILPYANQIMQDLGNISGNIKGKSVSYISNYKILDSSSFGIPQRRKRIFFLAIRKDIAKNKQITPDQIFQDIIYAGSKYRKHTLAEALCGLKTLKAPSEKNTTEKNDEFSGCKIEINNHEKSQNHYLKRLNKKNKIHEFVFNHKARYLNDVNREIYKRLNQGEDATNHKIKDIMPYAHRNNIFKDKYYKLYANKPSRTITAHLKMDCHSHIHPYEVRSITPREAARIQSFPDNYFFLGAYLKTYQQIGNAVPPLLANCIAQVLKKHIK
jgi:DNA (cytosine-5)-methyltransferase 1